MVLRLAAVVSVCLSALSPSGAQAQWSPSATLDFGMGLGNIALGQSALGLAIENNRQAMEDQQQDQAGPQENAPGPVAYCAEWPGDARCQKTPAHDARVK